MTTTVRYSQQATNETNALPDKLRVALKKAEDVLAADPCVPPSEELGPGCRRVRASQSLTLTYRHEGAQLLVTKIQRHERGDAPTHEDHLE